MGVVGRTGLALLAIAAVSGCTASDGATEEDAMNPNEQVVVDFIQAWSRLDPAELASFFTEDGIYYNMPSQPVQGRANVEAFIGGFTASWSETTWDVLNIVSSGDVVMAERVDRTRAGDKSVDLPVVGVFELEGGKIKVWRDYFDLATYTRGMS
jgi:limonene-1,2-epoxide hydrolase